MRITVSDIQEAEDFAKRLDRACEGILNGQTRTETLGRENISLSIFLTLIKGLQKSTSEAGTDTEKRLASDESTARIQKDSERHTIDELRHPAWQDELMRDVTGDEYFYLPPDFDEAFHDTMGRVLDCEEQQVIELLYKERQSYSQTAEQTGLSENTVRARRKSALKKLKEHADEFVVGKKFIKNLNQAKEKQAEYEQALDWMDEAIDCLDSLGVDEKKKIDDQPVSPEALAFYRRNGLVTLADVIEHTLPELFTRISDEAEEDGAFLAAVRSGDFSLDSPLDESIGLDVKTANAFDAAGIYTVREFLALPEDKTFSIKGVGPKTVVYIYRRVLFG